MRIVDGGFETLRTLIPWVGGFGIAYMGYRSIDALAGKITVASFLFQLFANRWFAWLVTVLFGGGGTVYGWRQKRLRHAVTARLTKRTAELELKLDPNRSSSSLTTHGETNSRDV
jgi:hypothetical protein